LERMQQQILPSGDMPLETKRVNSRSYYSMNLKLFIEIGKILRVDLKRYPLLVGAVNYYSMHAGPKTWEFSQEIPFVEEYDNYFYYNAKKYFGLKDFKLNQSLNLQHILFADVCGGGNET
ncbi:MAG: alginate lyase family protein, partial [Anaeroplasmataceae bacterium]|nr:alginate lyase family protein [Anaeroplasmataceae bacterium]